MRKRPHLKVFMHISVILFCILCILLALTRHGGCGFVLLSLSSLDIHLDDASDASLQNTRSPFQTRRRSWFNAFALLSSRQILDGGKYFGYLHPLSVWTRHDFFAESFSLPLPTQGRSFQRSKIKGLTQWGAFSNFHGMAKTAFFSQKGEHTTATLQTLELSRNPNHEKAVKQKKESTDFNLSPSQNKFLSVATSIIKSNNTEEITKFDISSIDEAQVLLACRAYLLRKHKLEWRDKKRRSEEGSSPVNNLGYFWHDPTELAYLRERPDPNNLDYDISFSDEDLNSTNVDENSMYEDLMSFGSFSPPEDTVNPNVFSTNPTHPTSEHINRSRAKLSLWNNSTWKRQWYKRRWRGRANTPDQKIQRREEKLLGVMPSSVLESPMLSSMSDDEVREAIVSYILANKKKSEARSNHQLEKEKDKVKLRKWKKKVRDTADELQIDVTNCKLRKEIVQKSANELSKGAVLSFEPSVEVMQTLRKKRSEQSKKAFKTRLANADVDLSLSKRMRTLRRKPGSSSRNFLKNYDFNSIDNDGENGMDADHDISPMQAILRIDMALDNNETPSSMDVETILKPGRLGRRRAVLRRILSECFGLRGKCVPRIAKGTEQDFTEDDQSFEEELLFVTACTIEELGRFVLEKLRQKVSTL